MVLVDVFCQVVQGELLQITQFDARFIALGPFVRRQEGVSVLHVSQPPHGLDDLGTASFPGLAEQHRQLVFSIQAGRDVTADQGVFNCDLDVLISDAKVVTNLCREIKKVKGVNSATRMS